MQFKVIAFTLSSLGESSNIRSIDNTSEIPKIITNFIKKIKLKNIIFWDI